MRLLHTADWHLGRLLHRVPLLDAQAAVIDHLVELAREEQVDAIVLAGDVFDRALPPVEAVQLAGEALRRLAEVAPVIAISGNHDSAQRLGFAADLIAAGGVHLRTDPARCHEPVLLEDEDGPVAFYGLPYLDPDLSRGPLGVEERSHEAVLEAAMARVRADLVGRSDADGRAPRAVVVAHAFVQGGETSESERDISIGGAQTVSPRLFDGVAYTALGHLHRPHVVGAGGVAVDAASAEDEAAEAVGTDPTALHDVEGPSDDELRDEAPQVSLFGDDEAPSLFDLEPVSADTSGSRGSSRSSDAAGAEAPAGAFALASSARAAGSVRSVASTDDTGGSVAVLTPEAPPSGSVDGPATVRYAGSPLPYSFTEADAEKTTAIVDLDADGSVSVRTVPVPVPFRLVRLRGTLDELLADDALADHEREDHWLEVTLTDARLPARPMERLRRRFPVVLVLQHEPDGELAPATIAAARVQGRTDLEVLERFVEDVRGLAAADDETPLLREAVEYVTRDPGAR